VQLARLVARAPMILAGAALVFGACARPAPAPPSSARETTQQPAATAPGPAAQPRYDYVFQPNSPILKAYSDRILLPVQKGDAYDDIRATHPERYAITVPPANIATVRPMVEWEPMRAIVMQYVGYMTGSSNATQTALEIAKNAATVAEVWFIVDKNTTADFLRTGLADTGMSQADIDAQVKFLVTPDMDAIWAIDFGPLPIVDTTDGTWAFADFRYYHQRAYDDGIPTVLGRGLPQLGVSAPAVTYRMPLNTEGGTFQATSDGVCVTGSRQLVYMTGDWSYETMPLADLQTSAPAQEMKSILAQYVGCKDLIVLHSITDDGTGHIDMFLKIVNDDTVLVGDYPTPYANDAQQTNAARMDGNADFLAAYVKPNGGQFTVARLVMPGHRSTNNGPVPFTYINSTFLNGLNLWPAFTYPEWEASRDLAQQQWEAVAPDMTHIWIDSEELSFWSGAIHCITRTIPAGEPGAWVADGTCDGDTCAAPAGGYSGECQPANLTTDVCWGPEWECTCNDCGNCGTGTPVTGLCENLGYEGCCEGTQLKFCESGQLKSYDCGGSCGWDDANGWYDCDQSGSDPSGQFARECSTYEPGPCAPDCAGKTCGDDGCGGSCGTCPDGQTCTASGTCQGGTCAPDCAGKTCGDDGCGGSCGTCPNGQTCTASGTCQGGTPSPECATLPAEGECQGTVVRWCEGAQLQTYDCAAQGKVCGMKAGVGNTCVDAGSCTPQCAGKSCGDDGCGGSCGACPEGQTCTAAGACEAPAGSDATGGADAGGTGGADATTSGDGASVGPDAGVPYYPPVGSGHSPGCEAAGGGPASPLPVLLGLALVALVRRRRAA